MGATAAGGLALGMAAEAREMPNVLVIHTDQHRIDCLGAYGNKDIRTPNIDALAAEGVRYENSFCSYPVCTPSRYSLLSGQYVFQHRGWTNHCTLPPGTPTFASELRAAGYRTKAVGKMHFTPTYLDVGFDEMELSEQNGPGRWDDDYHRYLRDHDLCDVTDLEDQEQPWRGRTKPAYWEAFGAIENNLAEEHDATTWIGDRAAETLETWEGGGHLLMAGFIRPHHPFNPPTPWSGKYDPEALAPLPGWIDDPLPRDVAFGKGYFPHDSLNVPALRKVMAYYYACIEQIDAQVGRMVEILKQKGLYDKTLIVFTSDHGEYLGFHHLLLKGNHLYDPVTMVPLIIKFPGGTHGGTVSRALVSNIDVAPTLLRHVGCPPPASMGGLDLVENPEGHPVIFSENRGGAYVMARTATHKLIVDKKGEATLLFDLEKDPYELNDCSADPAYGDVLAGLQEAITGLRPFEDLPETYLDEHAPIVQAPNAQPLDEKRREDIVAYYTEKMAKVQGV